MQLKIGQTLTLSIYGHPTQCKLLAFSGPGTLDVERLSDGKCFRDSGMVGAK